MSESAVVGRELDAPQPRSRTESLLRVAAVVVALVVVVAFLQLVGIDVTGWLSDLWDQISDLSLHTILLGVSFQTVQTIFAGVSYYGILRVAYPGEVRLAPIIASYAVGVAMNGFLPANIGTFVTLLMFVAIIPSATVGGAFAAYLVQKIFFTIAGTFVYLYLFLSVPGSFDENLGGFSDHPGATIVILVGGADPDRPPRPDLLAPREEALGPGQAGRRDPHPAQGVPPVLVPSLPRLLARQARRDRGLPRRLRDPRHVRVGDVGDGIGLARERRLGDAGRGGHHAGDQRAGARHVLRRAP